MLILDVLARKSDRLKGEDCSRASVPNDESVPIAGFKASWSLLVNEEVGLPEVLIESPRAGVGPTVVT